MAVTVIEYDLQAWLEGLSQLAAAGAKVYPWGGVPQNAAWPFVCYQRVTGGRIRSTKGPVGVSRPLLQIDVFAKTYKAAKDLAAEIREELDAVAGGTVNGRRVQLVMAEDETGPTDDGDDPTPPPHGGEVSQFRESIPVRLWFQE